jgi:ABC-type transport system involved in multi-copper enzyme maturation permease subunit
MNATPYLHLLWKEYRATRTFWLALVGLVILAQFLTLALSQEQKTTLAIVFGFALAAPVLFALGSAGASFAMEKEEGTYDFLQCIPVTTKQILTSKLLLSVLATLAMYLLLVPISLVFTHGTLPEAKTLSSLVGLWCVGALEAIAWGTFFSLLISRPLVAIVLAVAAASTVAHISALSHLQSATSLISPDPYAAAAVSRIWGAVLVLAVDVYLGINWLHKTAARWAKKEITQWLDLDDASPRDHYRRVLDAGIRSDRTAAGRLLWQHFRQSLWLMLLMPCLQLAAVIIAGITAYQNRNEVCAAALCAVAALMGSMVFLADQERRRYRFFVEHNAPPRYVWLTRQVPWLLVAMVSTWAIYDFALTPHRDHSWVRDLWLEVYIFFRPSWFSSDFFPFNVVLWCAIVSYCAGQWASMHIRSGLTAGFCGVLLAAVLSGWVLLMSFLPVNWHWSVLPVPLVLLWATRRRTSDWIQENTSWRARGRAAAWVLVPAAAISIAVVLHRAYQIPLVSPGFDPAAFVASTPRDAMETADLYGRASDQYADPPKRESGDWWIGIPRRPLSERQLAWLKENHDCLALLLQAAGRPNCAFVDPRHPHSPYFRQDFLMAALVLVSGIELEQGGKLEEALDRYFAALRVNSDLGQFRILHGSSLSAPPAVLGELPIWAAQKGQSTEVIRAALARLKAIEPDALHLDDTLKLAYLVAREAPEQSGTSGIFSPPRVGGPNPETPAFGDLEAAEASDHLWGALMPWERSRANRLLNMLTATSLGRISAMQESLDHGNGVVNFLPFDLAHVSLVDYLRVAYRTRIGQYGESKESAAETMEFEADARAYWRTRPQMWGIGGRGILAASEFAKFEARRRGTLLVLALEAYRLDHGKLPDSLDALVGDYLDALPRDPYSGTQFRYFPDGLPAADFNAIEEHDAESRNDTSPSPGKPCVWCTSEELLVRPVSESASKPGLPNLEYVSRENPYQNGALRGSAAWNRGFWFPIPDQQK